MGKINVALIGVGNCSSSLVQGVEFYKNVDEFSEPVPGLANNVLHGYKVSDINFVAAFDINKNKVGKDLSEAIFVSPNNSKNFSSVPRHGVLVQKGPVLDGLGEKLKQVVPTDDDQQPIDISDHLIRSGVEIVVNYLPTGSKLATEFYAEEAIKAKCGFINAMPIPIATNPSWRKKFNDAKLPVAGDDIKSQIGATALIQEIVLLMIRKGVKINGVCQLNTGGNADFLNLSEKERYNSKEKSKTETINRVIPYDISNLTLCEFFSIFKDNKHCNFNINGTSFGNQLISIDGNLNVEDSPNSAGIMIDVIRQMKNSIECSSTKFSYYDYFKLGSGF